MTAEQIIKECQERIDEVGDETVRLVEKARGCIERLDKIALKPDPLSTDDYIDLMIEAEKAKAGDELTKRIQALMQLKERQEMRRNVAMGEENVLYDKINFVKGDEKRQSFDEAEKLDDGHLYEEIPYKGGNMTHVVDVERNQDGHMLEENLQKNQEA